MKKPKPVNLKKVKRYPISKRKSLVRAAQSAKPHSKGSSFRDFMGGLPDVLASRGLKAVVKAVAAARANDRPVVLGMGAHPVKTGLGPVIIDLMEKGVVTALASNGACIIHDFEMAFMGRTSEDVAHELKSGKFGMAKETGDFLNRAIKAGVKKGLGIGESVGEAIHKSALKHRDKSIYARGYSLGLPMSVHVALGADIIHMHPGMPGAETGEGSLRDFRLLASVLSELEGGVYINLGSAVIMPEVFLKALNVARNLGHKVERFTTVNMDFIQHYRACQNVLHRPTDKKGASYAITGHHEIMLPLLAAAIIEEMP